ncbi:MAG: DUF3107 domain-containing protein [Acidimicrobiia bacterium]|nr:DUF3107 domain-containing protein [Acidimicrobiia bacterium]
MSETFKVRLGIEAARELEIDVEDPEAVSTAFEKAVAGDEPLLWITDAKGHRFGVAVDSIAFIELEQPEQRGIGFGAS